jgi:hypothetical protein
LPDDSELPDNYASCPTIIPKCKAGASNDSGGNQDDEPSPEGGEINIVVAVVIFSIVIVTLIVVCLMLSYPRYLSHIGFTYGAICLGLSIWLSWREKFFKNNQKKHNNPYHNKILNTSNNDSKVILPPCRDIKDSENKSDDNNSDADDSEDDYDSLHNRPPRGES